MTSQDKACSSSKQKTAAYIAFAYCVVGFFGYLVIKALTGETPEAKAKVRIDLRMTPVKEIDDRDDVMCQYSR